MKRIVFVLVFASCASGIAGGQQAGGAAQPKKPAAPANTLKPQEKPVQIEKPTEVQVCGDCPEQRVEFRVTALDKAGPLTFDNPPRVAGVTTNGRTVADLHSRFKTAWKKDEAPASPPMRTLVLTVTPTLRVPGTYEVTLDFDLKQRPAAPRDSVKLTIPAAALVAPEKLLVTRTVWPWSTDENRMTFALLEKSRATGIQAIRLHSLPFANDTTPASGAIVLDQAAADGTMQVNLAAGARRDVLYRLDGEFPRGVTSGKVQLVAEEAAEPLTIPVEVRTRLSILHLAFAIVVGLVLSYLVKIKLQERVQLHEARVAAATLAVQVKRERSEFPDAEFQKATELKPLEDALKGTVAKTIEDARQALDTAWRNARQDVIARRNTFRTRFDGWKKLLEADWVVPPSTRGALATARVAATPAAKLDAKGDVGGATTLLDSAQADAADAIQSSGHDWQAASRGFFDDLITTTAGISPAIVAPLKRDSDAWRMALPAIGGAPLADPSTVQATLRQLMTEYEAVRDHFRDLRLLRREHDTVIDALTRHGADAAHITDVRNRHKALEGTLETAIDDPATARATLLDVLDALQKAWEAAFTSAGATSQMIDKVKARDYAGAAAALDAAARGQAPGGAPAPVALDAVTSLGLPLSAAPRAPGATVSDVAALRIDPFEALRLASIEEVKDAKWAQTLIVGGLFMAWALTTASGTFDGTVRGLFVALFSAFGLDLGIDAIRQKVVGKLFA